MKPTVTVAMLVYNSESYIKEAIESVLKQSYEAFELLIIDDGSADNSLKIISKFDDSRIRVVRNEKNLGIAKSRNRCLDLAEGKYIAIFDSDDIMPEYRLKDQIEFMENNPSIDVVSGDFQSIDGSDYYFSPPADNDNICYGLLFGSSVPNPAATIRKSTIERLGVRYNEALYFAEDFNFWVDLLPNARFANLKGKPYLYYRVGHKESISTATSQDEEKLAARNSLVNAVKKSAFAKLGLQACDEDFDTFNKVLVYPKRNDVTCEDVLYLVRMFLEIKKQAFLQKNNLNPNILISILDKKLEKALKQVL